MSTYKEDYYARNELAFKHLEEFAEELPEKDEIIEVFEWVASFISDMDLPSNSYWLNKANMFSIITLLAKNKPALEEADAEEFKSKLIELEENLPEEYRLAAREAVNNKKERLLRNKILTEALIDN